LLSASSLLYSRSYRQKSHHAQLPGIFNAVSIISYLSSRLRFPRKKEREIKSVFGSVVAGAFQIAFRAEMHANDVFLFFKNHF